MNCPYCDGELCSCGYYICPKCKVAMTDLELAIALRSKVDRELMERMTGRKVLQAEGKEG